MWLIETSTLTLQEFIGERTPPYAIFSHRWASPQDEVSQKEFRKGLKQHTTGYAKITNLCRIARLYDIQWAWMDTCCIDKKSSAELSEAINSMYMYYENAKVCIAYLADVAPNGDWRDSEWWTRGWTLQELLAPKTLFFFDRNWEFVGEKAALAEDIANAKAIPLPVLTIPNDTIPFYCVAQRLSWAADRQTSRIEDTAYCLLGLFRINMPLLYGEGKRAFQRLQIEIIRKYPDDTIFAWAPLVASEQSPSQTIPRDVLAEHPRDFGDYRSGLVSSTMLTVLTRPKRATDRTPRHSPCTITAWGIELRTDADQLVPHESTPLDDERWAVSLSYPRFGQLIELDIKMILMPGSEGDFSYQRAECQIGGDHWSVSHLDRTYKVHRRVQNKLFYLRYDSDVPLGGDPSKIREYRADPTRHIS